MNPLLITANVMKFPMDPKIIRNGKIVTYINLFISAARSLPEEEFNSFPWVMFIKLSSIPVLFCTKYKMVVFRTGPSIIPR